MAKRRATGGLAKNQAAVLDLLRRGYGVNEMCRKVNIHRNTYYAWRKKDPGFRAETERILKDPVHQMRILNKDAKAEAATYETWQKQFIGLYRQTGDRNQAILGCGKDALDVEAALDPKADTYDEVFHKLFLETEQRRLWQVEDNLLGKAEHDSPTARFILANRVKEKYGKLEGASEVKNLYWFTQKGEDEAGVMLDGLFGKRTVIEGEVVGSTTKEG